MDVTAKNKKRSRLQKVGLSSATLSVALMAGCSSTDAGNNVSPAFAANGQPTSYSQNIAQENEPSTWSRVKNFVVGTSKPAEPVNQPMPSELSLNNIEASPNLSTRLAQVAEQSGNRGAAIENYRRALEQDPRHLDAVMGLARLYDREGDFSTATTLYLQAVALDPSNASVQNDLGLCFARQSRFEEAEAALQKSVNADPEGQLYRNNLATVQVELRKYDQALENLKAVHAPAVAEYNLGYLLSQKQEPMQARIHFQAALQLNPQFTEAQSALMALGGPVQSAPGGNERYTNQPQPVQPAPVGPRFSDRYPNYPQAGQGLPQ